MRTIPAMVDMSLSPAEKSEMVSPAPIAKAPDYDYGLRICFSQETLDKLGMDDDVDVGDLIHIHAFARVTGISDQDDEMSGRRRRVELVLAYMSAEDEGEEDEEAEKTEPRRSKLYG